MVLGLPKPNILVVDDEPMVVEVVGRYLRRDGFNVSTASTGAEGLKAALDAEHPPHVIVLDVMLPGMDGLEVCKKLRQEHVTVPIILLTARGEEADRIGGLGIGADDYVVKPFSPGELVARVKPSCAVYDSTPSRPPTVACAAVKSSSIQPTAGSKSVARPSSSPPRSSTSCTTSSPTPARCSVEMSCSTLSGTRISSVARLRSRCTFGVCARRSSATPADRAT